MATLLHSLPMKTMKYIHTCIAYILTVRRTVERTDGGRMEGRMDRQINGRMDRRMYGWTAAQKTDDRKGFGLLLKLLSQLK